MDEEGHELRTYVAVLGGMLGAIGLVAFFGGLYASMRRAEGGAGYLSVLMIAGATIFAVLFMLSLATAHATGMAYAYEDHFKQAGVDPNTVRLLDVVSFSVGIMAGMGASLAMACVAIVSVRARSVVPQWLGWAAAVVALVLLFGFPLGFLTQALFGLWVLAVGVWRLISGRGLVPAVHPGGAAVTA